MTKNLHHRKAPTAENERATVRVSLEFEMNYRGACWLMSVLHSNGFTELAERIDAAANVSRP